MGISFSASLVVQTFDAEETLPVKRSEDRAHSARRRCQHHDHDPLERLLSQDILAMQKRIRAEGRATVDKGNITSTPRASKPGAVNQTAYGGTARTTTTTKAWPKHPLAQVMLPGHASTQGAQAPVEQPKRAEADGDWERVSLSKISPAHLEAMDLTDLTESLLEHPNDPDLKYTAEEEGMLRGIMECAAERERMEAKVGKRRIQCNGDGKEMVLDGLVGVKER